MPDWPREIDVSIHVPDVIHCLYLRYGDRGPDDYLPGKTAMRDTIMEHLSCSSLEAEEVVDLLEVEGYLEFLSERSAPEPGRGVWHVRQLPFS